MCVFMRVCILCTCVGDGRGQGEDTVIFQRTWCLIAHHTHVHAYSQANTHAVCHCALLLLSVGATSRQWQASRSHSIMRESRGLHLYTHTHFHVHTHMQRAVGFTPSPSLSITQQAFSATLLHYSKLPRALSHLETCDCVWMCVYVGGCGCLTEVAKKCVCVCVHRVKASGSETVAGAQQRHVKS